MATFKFIHDSDGKLDCYFLDAELAHHTRAATSDSDAAVGCESAGAPVRGDDAGIRVAQERAADSGSFTPDSHTPSPSTRIPAPSHPTRIPPASNRTQILASLHPTWMNIGTMYMFLIIYIDRCPISH